MRFSLVLTVLVSVARLAAADRVALVIGNGGYDTARLPNPPNDAVLVAGSLKQAGFKVIQKTDLGREGMRAAVREFSDALAKGDTALFYYAGHGAQVKGENYLIPVDAPLGMKEFEAEDRSVRANLVLAAMEESGSALNLVILDCCRDNPFARGWRSASTGLAEMRAPQETLIAYATAPGKAALDGEGMNSPYAAALAQEILRPGVKMQDVFLNVARAVSKATNNEQRPWIASDLLSEVCFLPNLSAPAQNSSGGTMIPTTPPAAAASPIPDTFPTLSQLDANADGSLSMEEFMVVRRGTAAEQEMSFARMDYDKDGKLSAGEYEDVTAGMRKLSSSSFEYADDDEDAVLSKDEFMEYFAIPIHKAPAEEAFKKMDANGDGRLSRAEFNAGKR